MGSLPVPVLPFSWSEGAGSQENWELIRFPPSFLFVFNVCPLSGKWRLLLHCCVCHRVHFSSSINSCIFMHMQPFSLFDQFMHMQLYWFNYLFCVMSSSMFQEGRASLTCAGNWMFHNFFFFYFFFSNLFFFSFLSPFLIHFFFFYLIFLNKW